jgi:hypothetical protein
MGKYTGEELDRNYNSMVQYSLGVQFLIFFTMMSIKFLSKQPFLEPVCRLLPVEGVFSLLIIAFTFFAVVPLFFGLIFLILEFGSAKAFGCFVASICCLIFSAVGCGLGAQILSK